MAALLKTRAARAGKPGWHLSGWHGLAALVALPTLVPLVVTLSSFKQLDTELWTHLLQYVLPQVLPATLWLVLCVCLGVAIIGTGLAALIGLCDFPGRRFFSWALMLPMAVPAYVLATAFIGMLDYSGAIASGLRSAGIGLPEIRSLPGLITVMSLALYPYVYLLARSAFATQSARAMEAARTLGFGPAQAFVRVALPMAMPAIAAGTVLAAMETLADFGTVAAFNYDTFTTAIYKAWFALFSLQSALQLAGALVLIAALLLGLQSMIKGRSRFVQSGPPAQRLTLHGVQAWAASAGCSLVLLAGFGLPVAQLGQWSIQRLDAELDAAYLGLLINSLSLGVMVALLACVAMLLLNYAQRRQPDAWTRTCARIATLGYALPGTLLAIGLYAGLSRISQLIDHGSGVSLALQSGLLTLLLALAVRFAAVAHAPLNAGMERIRPSLDEASQLMGVTGFGQIWKVHLPLLRPGMLTAAALVLVDVIKEMPITLMTRPFGWDTLSIRVFELTSEGQWERAALPAMGIVFAGLVPVMLLIRHMDRPVTGAPSWT